MYPTSALQFEKPWTIRWNFLKESCSTHISLQFQLVDFLLTQTGLGDIEVQSCTVSRPNGRFESVGRARHRQLLPGHARRMAAAR